MTSYQLRDTTTRQLLARDLADYAATEAAADRLDDELEHALAANGEGGQAASGCAWTSSGSPTASPRLSATTSCSSAWTTCPTCCPPCDRRARNTYHRLPRLECSCGPRPTGGHSCE